MEQEQRDELLNAGTELLTAEPPQDELTEQIIDGLAQSELAGRVKNAAETYNLAQDMEEGLLREIGQEVWNGFDDDDKTCSQWRENHTFWLSLYMQSDYAENSIPDRDWGATESVPILTEACDQFQARTYKVFFSNDEFVSAVPMRKTADDRKILEERAERIGKHMSYQLGYLDRGYKQDKDALFLGVALHGSFFTKTYFSESRKRFQVDNVRPTDLVVNYNVGPVRIENLRRKTHILYETVGSTQQLASKGFLLDAAKPSNMEIENNVYNIKVDETQGLTPGDITIKRDKPAVLLEQHLYLDLDDSGTFLPYIATLDPASRKILRLTIGYEADQMGQPLKDYEQIQYFTHYKYKENPDGFYGLGLGSCIGDLNSAVNIMLRQSMDAATLANDGNMSGFVSERLGLQGEDIRMSIGRMVKIPDTVGDLQNSIWTGQFPGPNAALLNIMQAMDVRAQRLGSITEATTGSTEKVVQPTALMNQIEQALEQFSASQIRLANSLSEEFQKIYRVNQKYLPLIEYFVVNNEPEQITRLDYADDMLIQPVFDPKSATQSQKIARAQAELSITMQNPVNSGRPEVLDAACRRVFEAMEVENIDELLPPQPMVENFDDQYVENMYFLMPKEARPLFDVFPEQDHVSHLAKMQELYGIIQQLGVELTPDQQEDLFKHQQKHQAYLYGQTHGLIPPGPVSAPPLKARSDVPMGDGEFTPDLPPAEAELLGKLVGGTPFTSGAAAGSGTDTEVAG